MAAAKLEYLERPLHFLDGWKRMERPKAGLLKMEVTFKYFAWVRERIGIPEEKASLPEGIQTVGDAIHWLKQRGGGYAAAFEREDIIRAAIDHVHAKHTAPVLGAREIAFFPPVTGG